MKYYKYNIVSKKNYDVNEIGNELKVNRGNSFVPERQAQEDELFTTSKRVSQFLLSEEEAKTLKSDPRIQNVELDIAHRDDIEIVNYATQTGDFRRAALAGQNLGNVNWGLKRTSSRSVGLWELTGEISETEDNSFNYSLAGEGVDIVIIDSGFVDHPDFHDERGVSRLQKINWLDEYIKYNPDYEASDYMTEYHEPKNYYVEDISNHGTSCASIAAGKLHGLAKKAHIYGMRHNVSGYSGRANLTTAQHLALIKDWHLNKNNNRPTVLSMSFGTQQTRSFDDVSSGGFRDSLDDEIATWNRGVRENSALADAYKIRFITTSIEATVESTDALVQELIDAGVHVVIAGGNNNSRSVKQDHPEYDNYVNFAGISKEYYYNRKGSPYAKDAIQVGALEKYNDNPTYKEGIAYFSTRGQGIDLFAAGDNCIAASSNFSGTNFPYEDGSSYYSWAFNGTSCAAPQVAGLMATYLSSKPNMSPQTLKEKIISDATQNIIKETTPNDYNGINSFLDSNNRVLYNRYNQANSVTYDTQTMHNVAVSKKPLFETSLNPSTYITDTHGVFYRSTNIDGIDVFQQIGSFDNDDTSNIYPYSKIRECQTRQGGTGHYFKITFSGDEVTNANWEKVEYNARADYLGGYVSIIAYRKDATYSDSRKSFTWSLANIVNIRTYTYTGSRIKTRNTLQFF